MTLNKFFVSVALILALIALFIGTPGPEDIHLNEIASLIETEGDHITPRELAEQLHSGRQIRLIDLRDSVLHFHKHICNAELMSIQQLLNKGIRRNEFVVLYSEGGIHASQAWILLKMKHYDSVYTLLGGFNGWKEEILNPKLYEESTEAEKQDVGRRETLSRFFGGEPVIISRETLKKKSARQDPQVKVKKKEETLRYQC